MCEGGKKGQIVKRVALLTMVVGALLLSMTAGVAVAKTFICGTAEDNDPDPVRCVGTNNDDQIGERDAGSKGAPDRILAKAGDDTINAGRNGGADDRDRVFGQADDDKINTNDGDNRDLADGGSGTDECIIDSGDSFTNCETVLP
jgi:hypothetical protein